MNFRTVAFGAFRGEEISSSCISISLTLRLHAMVASRVFKHMQEVSSIKPHAQHSRFADRPPLLLPSYGVPRSNRRGVRPKQKKTADSRNGHPNRTHRDSLILPASLSSREMARRHSITVGWFGRSATCMQWAAPFVSCWHPLFFCFPNACQSGGGCSKSLARERRHPVGFEDLLQHDDLHLAARVALNNPLNFNSERQERETHT